MATHMGYRFLKSNVCWVDIASVNTLDYPLIMTSKYEKQIIFLFEENDLWQHKYENTRKKSNMCSIVLVDIC